jgi:hypothetical protein
MAMIPQRKCLLFSINASAAKAHEAAAAPAFAGIGDVLVADLHQRVRDLGFRRILNLFVIGLMRQRSLVYTRLAFQSRDLAWAGLLFSQPVVA